MASEKVDVGRFAKIRPGELDNLRSRTRPCVVLVSHRRKFYLSYLQVAYRLGLSLTRGDVDFPLAKRLLSEVSSGASSDFVIAPDVRQHVEDLCAEPDPRQRHSARRLLLAGEIPSPKNPPPGCRFHTRCPLAEAGCRTDVPTLMEIEPGHQVACPYWRSVQVTSADSERAG